MDPPPEPPPSSRTRSGRAYKVFEGATQARPSPERPPAPGSSQGQATGSPLRGGFFGPPPSPQALPPSPVNAEPGTDAAGPSTSLPFSVENLDSPRPAPRASTTNNPLFEAQQAGPSTGQLRQGELSPTRHAAERVSPQLESDVLRTTTPPQHQASTSTVEEQAPASSVDSLLLGITGQAVRVEPTSPIHQTVFQVAGSSSPLPLDNETFSTPRESFREADAEEEDDEDARSCDSEIPYIHVVSDYNGATPVMTIMGGAAPPFHNWDESRRIAGGDPDAVELFFRSSTQYILNLSQKPPPDTVLIYVKFFKLNLKPHSRAMLFFDRIIVEERAKAEEHLSETSTPADKWLAANTLNDNLEKLFLETFGHRLAHWQEKFNNFSVINPATGKVWISPADLLANYFQITEKLRVNDQLRLSDEWDKAYKLLNDLSPSSYHSSHWDTLLPPLGSQLYKLLNKTARLNEPNPNQNYEWLLTESERLFRHISEELASTPARCRYSRPPGLAPKIKDATKDNSKDNSRRVMTVQVEPQQESNPKLCPHCNYSHAESSCWTHYPWLSAREYAGSKHKQLYSKGAKRWLEHYNIQVLPFEAPYQEKLAHLQAQRRKHNCLPSQTTGETAGPSQDHRAAFPVASRGRGQPRGGKGQVAVRHTYQKLMEQAASSSAVPAMTVQVDPHSSIFEPFVFTTHSHMVQASPAVLSLTQRLESFQMDPCQLTSFLSDPQKQAALEKEQGLYRPTIDPATGPQLKAPAAPSQMRDPKPQVAAQLAAIQEHQGKHLVLLGQQLSEQGRVLQDVCRHLSIPITLNSSTISPTVMSVSAGPTPVQVDNSQGRVLYGRQQHAGSGMVIRAADKRRFVKPRAVMLDGGSDMLIITSTLVELLDLPTVPCEVKTHVFGGSTYSVTCMAPFVELVFMKGHPEELILHCKDALVIPADPLFDVILGAPVVNSQQLQSRVDAREGLLHLTHPETEQVTSYPICARSQVRSVHMVHATPQLYTFSQEEETAAELGLQDLASQPVNNPVNASPSTICPTVIYHQPMPAHMDMDPAMLGVPAIPPGGQLLPSVAAWCGPVFAKQDPAFSDGSALTSSLRFMCQSMDDEGYYLQGAYSRLADQVVRPSRPPHELIHELPSPALIQYMEDIITCSSQTAAPVALADPVCIHLLSKGLTLFRSPSRPIPDSPRSSNSGAVLSYTDPLGGSDMPTPTCSPPAESIHPGNIPLVCVKLAWSRFQHFAVINANQAFVELTGSPFQVLATQLARFLSVWKQLQETYNRIKLDIPCDPLDLHYHNTEPRDIELPDSRYVEYLCTLDTDTPWLYGLSVSPPYDSPPGAALSIQALRRYSKRLQHRYLHGYDYLHVRKVYHQLVSSNTPLSSCIQEEVRKRVQVAGRNLTAIMSRSDPAPKPQHQHLLYDSDLMSAIKVAALAYKQMILDPTFYRGGLSYHAMLNILLLEPLPLPLQQQLPPISLCNHFHLERLVCMSAWYALQGMDAWLLPFKQTIRNDITLLDDPKGCQSGTLCPLQLQSRRANFEMSPDHELPLLHTVVPTPWAYLEYLIRYPGLRMYAKFESIQQLRRHLHNKHISEYLHNNFTTMDLSHLFMMAAYHNSGPSEAPTVDTVHPEDPLCVPPPWLPTNSDIAEPTMQRILQYDWGRDCSIKARDEHHMTFDSYPPDTPTIDMTDLFHTWIHNPRHWSHRGNIIFPNPTPSVPIVPIPLPPLARIREMLHTEDAPSPHIRRQFWDQSYADLAQPYMLNKGSAQSQANALRRTDHSHPPKPHSKSATFISQCGVTAWPEPQSEHGSFRGSRTWLALAVTRPPTLDSSLVSTHRDAVKAAFTGTKERVETAYHKLPIEKEESDWDIREQTYVRGGPPGWKVNAPPAPRPRRWLNGVLMNPGDCITGEAAGPSNRQENTTTPTQEQGGAGPSYIQEDTLMHPAQDVGGTGPGTHQEQQPMELEEDYEPTSHQRWSNAHCLDFENTPAEQLPPYTIYYEDDDDAGQVVLDSSI